MQDKPGHWNCGAEAPNFTAATEVTGWKRDERLGLFVFVSVLCAAVLGGAVLWTSGALDEGQPEVKVASPDDETSGDLGISGLQPSFAVEDVLHAEARLAPVGKFDGESSGPGTPKATSNGRAEVGKAMDIQPIADERSPRRVQIAQAVRPETDTDRSAEAHKESGPTASDEAASPDEGAGESGAAEPAWIAGLEPGQRPAIAPVIRQVTKESGWYSWALTGTTRPYPESFKFLEDQEAWYTPFSRPGMTRPYDLRGWHAPALTEGS